MSRPDHAASPGLLVDELHPRPMLSRVALALVATLLVGACGGDDGASDDGPGATVALSMENLVGYWAERPGPRPGGSRSATYEPTVLHIRPGTADEGVPWIGEFVATTASEPYGRAELRGSTLTHLPGLSGDGFDATVEIAEVRENAFTTTGGVEFVRQAGCAGPGSYLDAPGQAVDATYGPDGSLHVIVAVNEFLNEDTSTGHLFRPPGDCGFRASGLGGLGVDVAPDGTLRFIALADGRRTLLYIEAEYVGGNYVVSRRDVVTEAPFGETGAITQGPDGEPILLLARGPATRAYREVDGVWTEEAIPAAGRGSLTPAFIGVERDPEGRPIVRQGRGNGGALWNGTAWEAYEEAPLPEGYPVAYATAWTPDGDLVAALTRPIANSERVVAVFAHRTGDEWTLREVGLGQPIGLHVHEDGVVDMVLGLDPPRTRAAAVVSFPLAGGAAPVQTLVRPATGTQQLLQYDSVFRWYPVAAFGPPGETYVSTNSGGYRTRLAERGDGRPTFDVAFEFEEGTDGTIAFPELGVECSETCVVPLPWNQVVRVEGRSEVGNVRFTGNNDLYLNGIRWVQMDTQTWAMVVWHPYTDSTLPAQASVPIAVQQDRVSIAYEIPTGLEPFEASNPIALERFAGGDLLTVVNHDQGVSIDRRDATTGDVVATFDDCNPAVYEPPVAATAAGAAFVARSGGECGTLFGDAAGAYAVWLDDAMDIAAAEPIEPSNATVAFTDEGDALLLTDEYDPQEARQWVRMQRIARDGTRTEAELEWLAGRADVWGVAGGIVLRHEEGFSAYDVDGTKRWTLPVSTFHGTGSPVVAADVHDDLLVVGLAVERELTVGGRSRVQGDPDPSLAFWIVGVSLRTGVIEHDVYVPNYRTSGRGAVVPLGDGDWGIFEHPDGTASYALVREGETVERRSYTNDPPISCMGGGCPARPVFAVPASGGAWTMAPVAGGRVTYDAAEFSASAFRAHLTFWDPSLIR